MVIMVRARSLASSGLFAVADAGDPNLIANADIHRYGFRKLSAGALTAPASLVAAVSHCSLS